MQSPPVSRLVLAFLEASCVEEALGQSQINFWAKSVIRGVLALWWRVLT